MYYSLTYLIAKGVQLVSISHMHTVCSYGHEISPVSIDTDDRITLQDAKLRVCRRKTVILHDVVSAWKHSR